ncbi:hypothetical protein NDU88_006307 [Pleurodeles waltl]|uniref:Uncharacterized protein n=1 Tax=Pleurodeles waltl TaxID=8319 RepID=A0AAV7TDW4_PLEWA|nr:hypothetical protein NDU88_006307 [Pleurodeles waltl]
MRGETNNYIRGPALYQRGAGPHIGHGGSAEGFGRRRYDAEVQTPLGVFHFFFLKEQRDRYGPAVHGAAAARPKRRRKGNSEGDQRKRERTVVPLKVITMKL